MVVGQHLSDAAEEVGRARAVSQTEAEEWERSRVPPAQTKRTRLQATPQSGVGTNHRPNRWCPRSPGVTPQTGAHAARSVPQPLSRPLPSANHEGKRGRVQAHARAGGGTHTGHETPSLSLGSTCPQHHVTLMWLQLPHVPANPCLLP